MKKSTKIPRILKLVSVKGLEVQCIFNTGETRIINFKPLFHKWKVRKDDPEYPLLNEKEFKKVRLRNQTLSWTNIQIPLIGMDGKEVSHPYELSPDVLYKESEPAPIKYHQFFFGDRIKKLRLQKGLSQGDLALLSGTSKTYISRVENNRIEPEFTSLYKIVEVGLGKKIKVEFS